MSNPTAEFFAELAQRGHDDRFTNINGTLRFEVEDTDRVHRWLVEIRDGDLSVHEDGDGAAQTRVRTDRTTFDRIVTGEGSPVAAWVRGRFTVEGSLPLVRVFERMFPGPPGGRDPREVGRTRMVVPAAPAAADATAADARRRVPILDGNLFAVTDDRGDMTPTPVFPTGFFAFDTRFLSLWHLTVNGQAMHPLSVDDLQYYETRYFLVPGTPLHQASPTMSVVRLQSIGGSLVEELTVINHQDEPIDVHIRIDVGCDFADIATFKDGMDRKGDYYAQVEFGQLRLGYERDTFRRETVISSTEPAHIDEGGLAFDVRIEPHQNWSTEMHVQTLGQDGRDIRRTLQGRHSRVKQEMRQELDNWLARAPRLRSEWQTLSATYQRSLVDLAALRYQVLGMQTHLPAAGLPWFMTIYNRDTILTSFQTLPFTPEFAFTTLMLGNQRGKKLNDFQDEEPGKIWQEARLGESTAFEERPLPRFNAADTTPLWLILLDEYERWTGDAALVRQLEPVARLCLAWIDSYADALGNGYVWYQSRNPARTFENQCWKDSWDAISYQDGRLPNLPRATCELQGYAYDAKVRCARLARGLWNDPAYADQLEREAADLRDRFNRDFWIEDLGYYALALDPDGGQVDALTSNIGHLLWSGIVPPDRAPRLAEHLTGDALFSGWGVRTLATDARRYNPVGYHTGSVWPFDNALIAWGLRCYGLTREAALIADAIIDASQYFQHRLPEAFAGYERDQTKYPVEYPYACRPHAMSAGATLLLVRALLGLDPRGDHLKIEPALPSDIGRLELLDIPGRWGRFDAFGRGRIDIESDQKHA
jgi:glycogen debranching enzyme